MKHWKIAFFALLVAAIGSNLWWAYGALDVAVSMTYQRASLESTISYACDAEVLAEALGVGLHQDTVLHRTREVLKDSGFVKEGAYIIGALSLTFTATDSVQVSSIWPGTCARDLSESDE